MHQQAKKGTRFLEQGVKLDSKGLSLEFQNTGDSRFLQVSEGKQIILEGTVTSMTSQP